MALHRAGQAAAECFHRELQRTAARRAVERDALHFAQSRPRRAGDLDGGLQHHPAAQLARQSAASHLCQTQRSRNATGRGAALHRGLRAPSHCITEPSRLGLYSSADETRGSGQILYVIGRYVFHRCDQAGIVRPRTNDSATGSVTNTKVYPLTLRSGLPNTLRVTRRPNFIIG